MSFIRALLGGPPEGKVADATNLTWSMLVGPSKSGVTVSIDTAICVSAVFACARVLADDIAKVPWRLYRETGKTKNLADKHPLYPVLSRRPNEWMTSFEFRETMMYHAVLAKGGFAWINRDRSTGEVLELLPLLPNWVTVRQAPDFTITYAIAVPDGTYITLPRSEIFHLRGPSWNGYLAMESVRLAREAIGLSIAAEESQAKLHANGGRPGGILTTDQEVKKDAKDQLRAEWAAKFGPGGQTFGTAVLDANFKYQQIAMSGVDVEHLATRKFQVEEIARFLRVYPFKIGFAEKTSTFASAEQFNISHVTDSLQPWAERLDQAADRDLLSEDEIRRGYFSKIDLRGLMRGDAAARTAYFGSGIKDGWMTRNEARAYEDLNPLEGLDVPLMPLNMSDGSKPPEPPQPKSPNPSLAAPAPTSGANV
jgi:HK97 family phage portal protein